MSERKKAVRFTLSILPFMLNIALLDFFIPLKYDVVLENLPLMGLLITIAWILTSFLDFSVGDLTDKIGIRKTIQIGVIFAFAGAFIFGISENFLIMTFGVFLWGLSYIMLAVPSDTYIFSSFSKKYTGSAYGIMYFIYDLSYAFAPLIGFLAIKYLGINNAIVSASIIVLIAMPLIIIVHGKNKKVISSVKEIIVKDGIWKKEILDIKKMNIKEIALMINIFVFGLWFMTIMIGAPLLFFHEEKNLLHSALLTFCFMIPFAFFEIIYSRMANSEKTRRKMIYYGFLISSILLGVFYFSKDFKFLLILAVFITLFTNMAWVASEVFIAGYLPKNKKGEFTGIFITAKDLGFDLAPLFYGISAFYGLKIPFIFLGIILFLAGLFYLYANKKNFIIDLFNKKR